MHIHSYYSDGTMSPAEIFAEAKAAGVTALAIADHDTLEGSIKLGKLCEGSEIDYIPGVELDALDRGINIHVLAYYADFTNARFVEFTRSIREKLDNLSVILISEMEKEIPAISLAEYDAFAYRKGGGGWKALHYLMHKGFTKTLMEGIFFYPEYGATYDKSGFPSVAEVCAEVHAAGGKAILAHPQEVIRVKADDAFERELRRLISYGLDGVECYYPSHSSEVTETCVRVCDELGLLITAGSDCHGDFGSARINEMKAMRDVVRI